MILVLPGVSALWPAALLGGWPNSLLWSGVQVGELLREHWLHHARPHHASGLCHETVPRERRHFCCVDLFRWWTARPQLNQLSLSLLNCQWNRELAPRGRVYPRLPHQLIQFATADRQVHRPTRPWRGGQPTCGHQFLGQNPGVRQKSSANWNWTWLTWYLEDI